MRLRSAPHNHRKEIKPLIFMKPQAASGFYFRFQSFLDYFIF
jgi:hypothetical protein